VDYGERTGRTRRDDGPRHRYLRADRRDEQAADGKNVINKNYSSQVTGAIIRI